jgi:hypothetical protein
MFLLEVEMKSFFDFEMKLATREWARQFYTAVVKNFAKTITEPVTNSDTSYKRKLSLPDASGLVEKALAFKKGTQLDLSQCKKELASPSHIRDIEIHVYTAQGHGCKPRTCEIVDFAEGLNLDELYAAFEMFAADKSGVSKGKPGRSLFGRGVSDVLLGHHDGTFLSYRDGILSKVDFSFDPTRDSGPKVRGKILGKSLSTALNELHLRPGENGSCVRFVLHDDCHIPDEGTIVPALSQFYMLRLINADPNVRIKVFRYRAGKKVHEDTLDYDFPIGDVVDRFSFSILDPVPAALLADLHVDAIVCRANIKGGLPGREAREQRANGLLIVDDKDAVLDLTFLPQFEGAPHLASIFGIIRIENIRNVFDWFLNRGKDSPLTTSRDGFDQKHDFTKLLFKELSKRLEPIYKREEERFNKLSSENISKEARQRINEAIKELNRILKDLTGEGEGPDPLPPSPIDPLRPLQFVPGKIRLTLARPRVAKLYLRRELASPKGTIIYDTSNPKIEIKPLSQKISEGKVEGEHHVYEVSLKCDTLRENAKIIALADGIKETFEAQLELVDVISATNVLAPDDIEFRPKESRGQPSRSNTISLYINPSAIPLGRKIKLEVEKQHGTIGLLDAGKRVETLSLTFEKSNIIPGTNVGRFLVYWAGTGWGQSARVIAKTKKPDGSLATAEGRIVLEQPEESGGIIRDVKYTNLGNTKCSDLVDGVIYINSSHYFNKAVFGSEQEYATKLENDHTAQYRLSTLVVEQCVFRLAEDSHTKNKLVLDSGAPVTSLREFIDQKTHQFAPKILKTLITK